MNESTRRGLLIAAIIFALGGWTHVGVAYIQLRNMALLLNKAEWRCVEYMPGSADCAVYERVGR